MDAPAQYIHWGFILLSVPNLAMIGLMLAIFAAALIVPFPGSARPKSRGQKK